MKRRGTRRIREWVAAACLATWLGALPATSQVLQVDTQAADWATPLSSELTAPTLTMAANLLAAAGIPDDRDRTTVAQAASGAPGQAPGGPSLEDLAAEMDNPLGKLWLMFLQNDTMIFDGDPLDEEIINMTVFMPVLSIPLGPRWNFVVRPILPFLSAPKPRISGEFGRFPDELLSDPAFGPIANLSLSTDREFEFGDMMLMTAVGPSGLVADKFVMGLGPTFMFPTASDDFFGSEKFSIGPAVILVFLGEKWKLGFIAQHWWSVAGESDRPDVSTSNIQYLIYYELPKLWSIGMGPNILVNWEADDGNKLTFPIGLGFSKTTLLFGKLPFRFGVEVHYAVVHPDDFGQRWNFRVYVVPVLPSPFTKKQMQP